MTQPMDPPHRHREIPDPNRPKPIATLAAMATNILRPRDNNNQPVVRYIAQVDKDGWMLKRSKVGGRMDMFVILEGTTLTILKNRSAPPRHVVNVRSAAWNVDVHARELLLCVSPPQVKEKVNGKEKQPGNEKVSGRERANGKERQQGRDRWLRLHIPTEDEAYSWKHALDSALNSDITDYYSFGDTLGSGAYGDVVEGFDVRTNEKRAVKIIKKGSTMKSQEHLECEITVMKSISHENIVQTYQIFDLKRTIYIVMEFVAGGDLFDFVAQHDSLTEAQGSQCIRSIFTAVEYLHRHSIVHRDLKPENILCANNSWPLQIKVSDFGFARFIDPSRGADDTMHTQVGTAYFMAPEIIANQGHGPAVDSWACGVILYTILTGRLPFPGRNTKEYFGNVLRGRILFPAVLWKGISPDAMSLVKGLLNLDPNKRLTSLAALQHRWIASPSYYGNEIRRDRSNLHSRRRRLFKARKAVIAVAMANKFKATIPQVVDKVGDSTKKMADGIGEGVKKTAVNVKKVGDGIGEGTKKVAEGIGEGTKKMAEGIGEGTKKVAEGIGEGTKKVAGGIGEGTKKVAGGIGTGVKKTVDGVEIGARKVGEGMKKTADGIEIGLKKTADGIEKGVKKTADGIEKGVKKTADGMKKTADGIETGLKKTADGIENGWKKTTDSIETGFKKTTDGIETGLRKTGDGFKKTGEGIKRGVEKVMPDRERSRGTGTEGGRSTTAGESDSTRGPGRRRILFARRGNVDSVSSAVSESDSPQENGVPTPTSFPIHAGRDLSENLTMMDDRQSSSEYYSANEEQSDTEEGWERIQVHGEGLDIDTVSAVTSTVFSERWRTGPSHVEKVEMEGFREFPDVERGALGGKRNSSLLKQRSNGSGSSGSSPRPKLAPLDGLTMGLSEDCMAGTSRDLVFDNVNGVQREGDNLRKMAALLLAAEFAGDVMGR